MIMILLPITMSYCCKMKKEKEKLGFKMFFHLLYSIVDAQFNLRPAPWWGDLDSRIKAGFNLQDFSIMDICTVQGLRLEAGALKALP